MSATAETEFENDTAIVAFGRDEAGRPRASAFGQSEADLATKAAGLMGMQLLRIETTISSRCHLPVDLGRSRRKLRANRGPNFKTQRRMLSYEVTMPRSTKSSSTSR